MYPSVPFGSSNSALSKLLTNEQLKPRVIPSRLISISKSGLDLKLTSSAFLVSSSDTEWLMLNLTDIL